MNDPKSPDHVLKALKAVQKEIPARNDGIFKEELANFARNQESLQRELARIAATFAEPVQQIVRAFQDINKGIAAWRLENQEVIASFQRFIANVSEVSAHIAEVAAAASKRFQEVLKRSDHIAKLGWTFPCDISLPDLIHLSELTNSADADAYVMQWYAENDPQLEDMERRLRENARLAPFSTVLPQCFSAIRRGDYAITIPSLIPIIEAVLTQLNPPHLHASTDVKKTLRRRGKVAKQAEDDILAAAIWLSLVTFFDNLYAQYPLAGGSSSLVLSRSAIEHGRKEPPNERVETIRLLHALETALSLHKEISMSLKPGPDSSRRVAKPGLG